MKFSIVTPVRNGEKFIEQTICSVLDQAGDFSLEYIIADGGSTDGTLGIIKKYQDLITSKKYPIACSGVTFTYWSQQDGGQTQALNAGFAAATGDVFAWINADDYYEPGAFKKVLDAFNNYQNSGIINGSMEVKDLIKNTSTLFRSRDITKSVLAEENVANQPSVFFKRVVFEKAGPLDVTLQYRFDHDFFIKAAGVTKFYSIPDVLSVFRIWESSKTYSQEDKFKQELVIVSRRYSLKKIDQNVLKSLSETFPAVFLKNNFPGAYQTVRNFVNKMNARKEG